MAKRQFTRTGTVPAVAYLRRSTSRQEKSLDDQRTEIEQYAAANGYRIVRWYQDDGISGDATERRDGFLAFHKAACNGRDFDVILVWDQDRFGRFDSMEAGYWIHPLRKAGVRLVSVTEGPINWDDFTGRVMYSLKQEGKHQFLRDLSRNVSRGQISNAQKGLLCGQAAPYGYDRMLVDEAGEHRQRIRNGEKFAKAASWRTTLVPSDDAVKVSTVRWLFQTYADTDTGLRSLADQLNARGVPGPTGGPWYAASIKAIFENRNYTGTFTWAKRREGKYHSVAAGQIRERDRSEVTLSPAGKPHAVDNPREAWIVVEDAHEALIDKALFERVQAKMHDRRRRQVGPVVPHPHPRQRRRLPALGAGLLRPLRLQDAWQHADRQGAPAIRSTSAPPTPAAGRTIRMAAVATASTRTSWSTCSSASSKRAFCRATTSTGCGRRFGGRSTSDRAGGSKGTDGLRKQLADLDREIDRAAENFLRAPAEVLDLVGEKLTALKRQREHVQDALRAAEAAGQAQGRRRPRSTPSWATCGVWAKKWPRPSRPAAGRSSAYWSTGSTSGSTKFKTGKKNRMPSPIRGNSPPDGRGHYLRFCKSG